MEQRMVAIEQKGAYLYNQINQVIWKKDSIFVVKLEETSFFLF